MALNLLSYTQAAFGARQFLSVYIQLEEDGSVRLNALLLNLSKQELSVEERWKFGGYDAWQKTVSEFTELPIIVCIDGKGVVHKLAQPGEDPSKVLGTHRDDFAIQLQSLPQGTIGSYARKQLVEAQIEQLELKNTHKVVGLWLGGLHALNAVNLIEDQRLTYLLGTDQIQLNPLQFKNEAEIDQNYTLGTETLNAFEFPLFVGVLKYLQKFQDTCQYEGLNIDESKKAYQEAFKLKRWIAFYAAGIFALLLLNMGLLSYFDGKNNELDSVLSKHKIGNQNVKELQGKLAELQTAFEGQEDLRSYSYYLDRLGKSVPKKMNLSKVYFHPVTIDKKQKNKRSVESQEVVIQGFSDNAYTVNVWIQSLKNEGWIEEVKLEGYKKFPDKLRGSFEVRLKY